MTSTPRIDMTQLSDEQLIGMSREMGLALSIDEMKRIVDYFTKAGREATDVELQALGQAWSEHSCYKSSKVWLKRYVLSIPCDDFLVNEDAGVVRLDDDHVYVIGFESHNHPSAVEPYGGAATGIGGILRDVVCMGAQPIALIDPLFFGPLETNYADLPEGVRHPKYLFKRVVEGIRDYGNRVGIPTVGGMVNFHDSYLGNCLVNVGCIGVARLDHVTHSRAGGVGEIFVMAGGLTGRDGIHGVTFASEVLDETSQEDIGAVQLGDPITKEPLMHACLEAIERKLVSGMKDLGGGGLSSCVGELAYAAGCGAEVDLEKVPLGADGMKPWEIWISESQERMMLPVKPENLDEVLDLFDTWDVRAVPIGRTVPGNNMTIKFNGEVILDLDLDFYTGGPEYEREFVEPQVDNVHIDIPEPDDLTGVLLELLASPNIASMEWVVRQYDHQVRGKTVLPPMQGDVGFEGPGDSAVMKPIDSSNIGIALTSDVNPEMVRLDPYNGACSTIDETVRNLVSVGARPHTFADCLNFGNPEKKERMGEFISVLRGFHDTASALKVPFVSGNVSFYNEANAGPIPPTPTVIGVGLIDDVRKARTLSFKKEGNALVLIGSNFQELGGSAYYSLKDGTGPVPAVDIDAMVSCASLLSSAPEDLDVVSMHDVSNGGVATALAEMAIAGNLGASIDLSPLEEMRDDYLLFSESNTRWIAEMPSDRIDEFTRFMKGIPVRNIGFVDSEFSISRNKVLIRSEIEALRDAWGDYIPSQWGDTHH